MNLRNVQAILAAIAMLLMPCHAMRAQQSMPSIYSASEEVRIARLVGLAKVWGIVKFFHPSLAYRKIDWDKALVETIPKVNAARTPQEYEAAINHLLSFLNDKNTRAKIFSVKENKEQPGAPLPKIEKKDLVQLKDGILYVEALTMAEILAQEGKYETINESVGLVVQSLPQARALVLDSRPKNKVKVTNEDFVAEYFEEFLWALAAQISDRNVVLASIRYRMHDGYEAQTGVGSPYYTSNFVYKKPRSIIGQRKTEFPPTVVVTDSNTPAFDELFSGLQATKRVLFVQEGNEPLKEQKDFGFYASLKLADNVTVSIRTGELVYPDGSIIDRFEPDVIVPKNEKDDLALHEALKNIRENSLSRTKDKTNSTVVLSAGEDDSYPEMEFPGVEYRLLALFRFWNVINYFNPYKNLIDKPWEDVLPHYIPKFEANKEAADYQLTALEMVAGIQDSHVKFQGKMAAAAQRLGTYTPPFTVRFIENQTVVDFVFEEVKDLKVGDAILAVDGQPIEKFRERHSRYIPASTPQSLMRKLHSSGLFAGQKDTRIKLSVRGIAGEKREIEIMRSLSSQDPRRTRVLQRPEKPLPVFGVLPSGFGYVDLTRLVRADVDKMFETITNTRATIFDMRGYPYLTAWLIAPRLTEKKDITFALISRPMWEGFYMMGDKEAAGGNFTFTQKLPKAEGDIYKGKVVMLINEDAVSQAEHLCLAFEAATDVTFIGTPTTGANGNITQMVLPGNLTVTFTGMDVRHADGRQLQRVGIQPHIKVAPTIRGFVEGRDEILEAGVKYLNEKIKK